MKLLNEMTRALRGPALGLALAILVGTLLLVILGEKPSVLGEAFYNVLFTDFGLGYTLYYATPLIFTGLAVAVCFRCGLFNIGAEGQLYFGAVAIVIVSGALPNVPWWIGFPLGVLVAALAGGLWGGLAGFLKAKRGSHEVITTILLNFVALATVNYLVLYPLDNPEDQSPESFYVGKGYQLPVMNDLFGAVGLDWFKSTPVNLALPFAVVVAIGCYFFLFRTSAGFALRAVGFNGTASRFAGISVSKQTIRALGLGGALAGLVGVNEVMGYQHKVIEGFSPQYGFTGIAVALLARNHPIGVILAAFLFGALHNSARELEFLSERVTKELAFVLQGTLIAFVAAQAVFERWLSRRRSSGDKGVKS